MDLENRTLNIKKRLLGKPGTPELHHSRTRNTGTAKKSLIC